MSEPTASQGGGARPRFPTATLARVLLIPIVAVGIFVFLFANPGEQGPPAGPDGMSMISLVQKDAQFRVIPSDRGGATGTVWYTPAGDEFEFQLRAQGLAPRRRYLLEIKADDTIYAIASHAADEDGELAVDTTLTRFAEGACVGQNYDPPRPLDGRHTVRFWLKADGNPPSGTSGGVAGQPGGEELPCSGNGDRDYTYVLLENEVAQYAGPGSVAPGGTSGERRGQG